MIALEIMLTGPEYLKKIVSTPVYHVAQVTPLEPMPALSERIDNAVYVKREDLQPVHSFKIRGAFARMNALSEEEKVAGVVTASAGNHAQGVALSGKALNVSAVIVMPETTPEIKVEAVKALGGEVILSGQNFDAAAATAQEISHSQSRTYIPPFDDELVIAGQGTVGLEIFQEFPDVDRIFVPVGGGGLLAGIAVLIKQLKPEITVIGVEPEESSSLSAALEVGEPVELPWVNLFAEGVAVKKIGSETFRLAQEYVDEVITVTSDQISAAVKDLFDDNRAIAEPAGAVSLAGLKKYVQNNDIHGENLVNILSGANINFHGLRYISERASLGEGREMLLGVKIPEEKGSFRKFAQLLGDRGISEFNYRYHDAESARIFVGVQVQDSDKERQALLDLLEENGYSAIDLSQDSVAKVHTRYMVGGHPSDSLDERVFTFEFPEHPGALMDFLNTLGDKWNISAFHYRSFGMDYGRVLCAFDDATDDSEGQGSLYNQLDTLGYHYEEVSDSPSYQEFLAR